jgi:hypothetical protein
MTPQAFVAVSEMRAAQVHDHLSIKQPISEMALENAYAISQVSWRAENVSGPFRHPSTQSLLTKLWRVG